MRVFIKEPTAHRPALSDRFTEWVRIGGSQSKEGLSHGIHANTRAPTFQLQLPTWLGLWAPRPGPVVILSLLSSLTFKLLKDRDYFFFKLLWPRCLVV